VPAGKRSIHNVGRYSSGSPDYGHSETPRHSVLILSPQLQRSDLERHGLPWFLRRCHPGRRLPKYPVRLRVGQLLSGPELQCQGEGSRRWG
jgi:hypothetical protein